jgi:hypothetical protein
MRVAYLVQYEISDEWLTRKAVQWRTTPEALRQECQYDVENSLSDALAYKDYATLGARPMVTAAVPPRESKHLSEVLRVWLAKLGR